MHNWHDKMTFANYGIFLDESESENHSMAGVLIDAGKAVSNSTMSEKSDIFRKNSHAPLMPNMNGDASLWDENGKLTSEAKTYSDSKAVLKINHPLMIMVKEKRVVSRNIKCHRKVAKQKKANVDMILIKMSNY